jgi:hypothetical protein
MLLVASAVHEGTWNIAFCRTFGMEEIAAWVELRARLPPSLSISMDIVAWRLTPSGIFSISSAYRALLTLDDTTVEGSPTPKNKDLCMANATRSFAFRG